MAQTYKILGQKVTNNYVPTEIYNGNTVSSTRTESLVYEVPNSKQASISSISVLNSGSSATYDLSFSKQANVSATSININTTNTSVTTQIVDRLIALAGNGYPTSPRYGYSENGGITWTYGYDSSLADLNSAPTPIFVFGKWITVNSAAILTSTNGLSWDKTTFNSLGLGSNPFSDSYINISYANGLLFITNDGNNLYFVSSDGTNWQPRTFNANSTYGASSVVFDEIYNLWVALGSRNRTYKSSNGLDSWAEYVNSGISNTNYLASASYNSGWFIATDSWGGQNSLYKSQDAITWTKVTDMSGALYVSLVNGALYLSNTSGSIYRSTDSVTWNLVASGVLSGQAFPFKVVFKDGKYLGIQQSTSNILMSSDGISWTKKIYDFVSPTYLSIPVIVAADLVTTTISESTTSVPSSQDFQKIILSKTIASGEVHEIVGGITLSSGDQIRISSASDNIVVNVYGVEIA